jgi:hypothetical protein
MFDDEDETPAERSINPADQAREKVDELRVHAQLAAVFEAVRKFDAQILPGLNPDLARDIQRTMGKLEKSKSADSPILPESSKTDAIRLLDLPATGKLSTNDYHIHRRPGETMIVRWIEGEQVDAFYQRLQAHFDVGFEDITQEIAASEWKQDSQSKALLDAMRATEVKMAERYLRDPIRLHSLFVLSTQSADEMDILHLCDYIMGVPAADVVGAASASGSDPTEQDRAWFFKLFSLRGIIAGQERMCFFIYLQKSEDMFGDNE